MRKWPCSFSMASSTAAPRSPALAFISSGRISVSAKNSYEYRF